MPMFTNGLTVPDFRSSTGLFTTLRGDHKLKGSGKHLFDASVYKHDSSTSSFHDMLRQMAEQTSQAKPTAFHHLLASIAQEGRLLRLYTQNIDCLDTNMDPLATTVPLNHKGPWPQTIQLHGGLDKMVCSKCAHLETFDPSLFDGPEPPLCKSCLELEEVRIAHAGKRSHGVGKLRPRIVLYNEHHPDQDAIGSVSEADIRKVPDAVIVVGTTLKVPGVRRIVKEMCQVTRSRRDGITAWINVDPEPQGADLKDCWDLVIRGKCDHVAELTNLPHWDEQDIGDRDLYMVTDDERKEQQYVQRTNRDRVDVLLSRKRKAESEETESSQSTWASGDIRSKLVSQAQQGGGIPTPSASPKPRTSLPVKPLPKGKTKQSKLAFGNPTSAAKENQKKPLPAKTAKPRKPTAKSKAAQQPPKPVKNSLATAFKATKVVSVPLKQEKISDESGLRRSSRSRSISVPAQKGLLPSLRPTAQKTVEVEHTIAKQTTPEFKGMRFKGTISPSSKPRSMENLID
jgi:NAD-dependent histone deacetylase SIR2